MARLTISRCVSKSWRAQIRSRADHCNADQSLFRGTKNAWLKPRLTSAADDTVITTSDVWVLNRLCDSFSTDISTASRTLLTDIETLSWSQECAQIFGFESHYLPAIYDNDAVLGSTTQFGGEILVVGTCVDQQAALFAEDCHNAGEIKCTYGTVHLCWLVQASSHTEVTRGSHRVRHGVLRMKRLGV